MPPDFETLQPTLQHFFASRAEVAAAYLFGSVARGEAKSGSDVDVAVLLGAEQVCDHDQGWGYEASVGAELERVLAPATVDLVVLNRAAPLLKHQVINHGKVVSCRDASARVRFEVRAAGEYDDFLHDHAIRERHAARRTG